MEPSASEHADLPAAEGDARLAELAALVSDELPLTRQTAIREIDLLLETAQLDSGAC